MKRLALCFLTLALMFSCAISSDARVIVKDESVVKMGEDINVGRDLIFNDLVAIKGNVNVKGEAAGDVVAVLGNIRLFPSAKVGGDIVSIGGTVTRDKGSVVGGKVTQIMIGKEAFNMSGVVSPYVSMAAASGFVLFKIMLFLGFVGIAAITISFLTRQIGVISSKVESQWLNCLLWGVLGILLIAPVALLLTVTIIGIPLIFVEVLLISIAMTLGYVAVAQLVGKRFTKAIRQPNQPMLVEALWGLFILFLIDLVPLVGPVVKCIVVTIGFGSAILTKLGS